MPETRISDYAAFLRDLGTSSTDYFLGGGQAVNFWAEFYSARDTAADLSPFLPFTSKDCDIWVSYAAFKYIRAKTGIGKLFEGTSPADGQLAILSLNTTPVYSVDLMTTVYGVPQNELPRLMERALMIDDIRVIDPIFLFQSKCHCLLGLDQIGRQDEKHTRMLCHVVPAHFEGLLGEAIKGHIIQRALINELKLLKRILKLQKVRQALQDIGANPASLFPTSQLRSCGLTTVEHFANTALKELP
ncbi:MAG: hypothetical protein NWS48_13205 [Akkermansiaceae bacterium]|jgi:hypothetical protein|nr:hypothetical protein [Akkermansiaceae bacterium]